MPMEILQALINEFSVDTLMQFFRRAIKTFRITEDDLSKLFDENKIVLEKFSKIIKLGEGELQNADEIFAFSALSYSELSSRSGKKLQFEIAKQILKEENQDAAFFIFYDKQGHFRFSLIRATYAGTKRHFTTYKRYTYFVSPDQTNQTFIRQLSSCDFNDLDNIQKAFSVEPLNKQFYQHIAEYNNTASSKYYPRANFKLAKRS